MVCCGYFKSLEGFYVDVWTFKLNMAEDILAFFDLATVLATFSKILGNFSPNLIVTLTTKDKVLQHCHHIFGS